MRHFIIKICTRLFILLILLLAFSFNTHGETPPTAADGILDLRSWDFEKQGTVKLDGEWEFYWKKLFVPNDFTKKVAPIRSGIITLPDKWNGYPVDGKPLGGDGYATFRLNVIIPQPNQMYALKILDMGTAYKLWVNDKLILFNGSVGISRETMTPQYLPQTAVFTPQFENIQLTLQISNFYHRKGGVWKPIEVGLQSQINDLRESKIAFEMFLFGSLLIIGFYHFGLYLLRRKDLSPLFFGMVCSLTALRVVLTGERLFIWWFPAFNWEIFQKLEYLTFYLGAPLFLMFLASLFPELSRKLMRSILILGILFGVFTIATTTRIFSYSVLYYQIIIAVFCLYVVYALILAIINKREGAIWVLVGVIVLIATVFHDLLLVNEIIHSINLTPFGLFFFIFIQSIILSLRFSKAFLRMEIMSEKLSRMDKLKDAFLANTSHELRTPLNGIIGLTESLIDGAAGRISQKVKSNLSMIVSSGKRLSSLINDILDFSKLKNQDIHLQRKAVSLKTLTEVVNMLSKPLLTGKSIKLTNMIEENLPLANGDENRLQQILLNLVSNAIKFTESGEVSVAASEKDKVITVTVSDTGIGIPEDKYEDIFKSFEQLDSSDERKYAGTGLGLSITRQLIELHNGRIWVESEVGKGSQFKFTIAAAKDVSEKSIKDSQKISVMEKDDEEILVEKTLPKGKFNVLIVDDDPINLKVLENNLSLNHYSVTQALNGHEALEAVNKQKPDLILLDVMMPEMSGYKVCERIRETYPASQLPVLMLTAKNQVTDLIDGFESGANDYLAKPFSKNELLTRVKAHIELSQTNKAYGRFVPQEFLKLLKRESIVEVHLGENIQMDMSILFADIRSFTSLSESMSPEENFNFINSYLNKMEPVIGRHKGFIDKYIGDAIMALFKTEADDAVDAGIDMLNTLGEFNKSRQKEGKDPISIGIGINTGPLMLGTVGGQQRMEGTVISDDVNLASRLETLTKEYGASLIISEKTYKNLKDPSKYALRTLANVKPKGKSELIKIFEVCDGDQPEIKEMKLSSKDAFEEAVRMFQQQKQKEAEKRFQECLTKNPQDRAAQIYLVRCKELTGNG